MRLFKNRKGVMLSSLPSDKDANGNPMGHVWTGAPLEGRSQKICGCGWDSYCACGMPVDWASEAPEFYKKMKKQNKEKS